MESRSDSVSEVQWSILLEFLECNPSLARGYNNSAWARAKSLRLWQEVAIVLNAQGSGTTKTPKDWSAYVSNYKCKLKKIVADMNSDINGGGPSCGSSLSDQDRRLLAIMGPGFVGQTAPPVSVNPFPDMDIQLPSTSDMPLTLHDTVKEELTQFEDVNTETLHSNDRSRSPKFEQPAPAVRPIQDSAEFSRLPRQVRQTRYRSRPLGPLEEARRILSQVEMQRAAADAASARAMALIGHSIGRIADAIDRYLSHVIIH